jgi:hypothetical protein
VYPRTLHTVSYAEVWSVAGQAVRYDP